MEKLTIKDFKERYKDLKQIEVANKVNLSHTTISYLYSGEYPISQKITEAFEKGFGITLIEVSNETIEKNNSIDETIKKYEEKILTLQREKAYNIFSENFDSMISMLQKNKKVFFENETLNKKLSELCEFVAETKNPKKIENKLQTKTRKKMNNSVLIENEIEVKKEKNDEETMEEVLEDSNNKTSNEACEEAKNISEVSVQPFELEDFVETDTTENYEEREEETLTDEEIFSEVDSLSEYDNGDYDDTLDIFDDAY